MRERALVLIPRVTFAPPTCAPRVPEVTEIPEPTEMEEVATDWYAPAPPPYMSCPDGAVVVPVPPPETVSVPDRDGVKVCVSPDETIVTALVRPFVADVDVAKVCVPPV